MFGEDRAGLEGNTFAYAVLLSIGCGMFSLCQQRRSPFQTIIRTFTVSAYTTSYYEYTGLDSAPDVGCLRGKSCIGNTRFIVYVLPKALPLDV
jgi:hypothetical protein